MAKKKAIVEPAFTEEKSDALKTLENNFDDIFAFIERMRTEEIQQAGKRLSRSIEKEKSGPKVNVKRLMRSVEKFGAESDKWLAFYRPANRWMAVMLVTYFESYLEDILIEIAKRNPLLIKNVDLDVRNVFEAGSIDELRDDVRRQWAHNALRPDGPKQWYRALKDRGAPEFDEAAMRELQHMWDTRNLIVHGKCLVDAVYARKYADKGAKRGERVKVTSHLIKQWFEPAVKFIKWADAFCLSYGGKLGEKAPAKEPSA
jgi:hypothetical protein